MLGDLNGYWSGSSTWIFQTPPAKGAVGKFNVHTTGELDQYMRCDYPRNRGDCREEGIITAVDVLSLGP